MLIQFIVDTTRPLINHFIYNRFEGQLDSLLDKGIQGQTYVNPSGKSVPFQSFQAIKKQSALG